MGHFKRSTLAYDKLRQIQQQLDISEHKLKQDELTRWNSTLYMLQSVVEQRMSLAVYGSDRSIPVLTATQLDIANKVIMYCHQLKKLLRVFLKILHVY